jgi:O-antigen/teichoic acid export membrane protein
MTELKEKISRNAAFTFLAHFLKLAVGFILLPYIVSTIGKERFGLWVIVAVVTQYCGLADMGIAHPLSKYIAEYYARREFDRINQVVTTGFAFYSVFGAVIIAVVYSMSGLFLRMFTFSPDLYPDALFALRIGVLIFVLELVSSCITSVLRGLQRIDVTRKVQMIYVVVNAIGTMLVLRWGYGLRGLFLNDLACFFLSSSIEIGVSFAALPTLKIARRFVSAEMFSRLFSFGIRVQMSRFSTLIGFQLDKMLIGYFLAVGLVTFYEIGAKISFGLRQLSLLIFPILVPAFSELSVHRSRGDIYAFAVRLTKILSFAAIPCTAFTIFAAPRFITAWMGPGYELSARVTRLLSIGYLTDILPLILYAVMQGMERPHFQMWTSFIFSAMNLVLSIALIRWIGFIGAPLGTCISMIIAPCYFVWAIHRFFFHIPLMPTLRSTLLAPCAASALGMLPLVVCNRVPSLLSAPPSRLLNLGILSLQGLFFLAAYLLLTRVLRYFSRDEKAVIGQYLPYARLLIG